MDFFPFFKLFLGKKGKKRKIIPTLILHFGKKTHKTLHMCRALQASLSNFLSIFNSSNMPVFHKALWNWASKENNDMLFFELCSLLHVLPLRCIFKLLPRKVSANLSSQCMRSHFGRATREQRPVPPAAPRLAQPGSPHRGWALGSLPEVSKSAWF